MKKFFKSLIYIFPYYFLSFLVLPVFTPFLVVSAQNRILCQIFPFLNKVVYVSTGICGGDSSAGADAVKDLIDLAQFGLTLVFVGIIAIAVYVVIKASVEYIRSEGDEEKVKKARNAIKQVFAGLAALFIGLIGLVIILTIFNATGAAGGAVQTPDGVEILNNVGL
ncbi:MAG: hypothetical protein KatS3mg086_161 [Candidatus Dojkabacteria bacterium]|nr:MAG: hypothetical protein KatS3mg086_161 [Candidatus Dojkabacteria bacterium]